MIDRKAFFDKVRESLFNGNTSQHQVDGMNHLLDVWEELFSSKSIRWLAYVFATTFHETAQAMTPVEEYGKGKGQKYGKPVGPYHQIYYGRGHVQLTWEDNYIKGESQLKANYGKIATLHQYPTLMLDDDTSALVMYDGMIIGWFTGVGLPKYFTDTVEDPYNARKIVNGLDRAAEIEGYYYKFKEALA